MENLSEKIRSYGMDFIESELVYKNYVMINNKLCELIINIFKDSKKDISTEQLVKIVVSWVIDNVSAPTISEMYTFQTPLATN